MMKKSTQKRINRTVFGYFSIMGLWENIYITDNNPVMIYFNINMLSSDQNLNFFKNGNVKIIGMDNVDEIFNVNISNNFFHSLVEEFYNTYKNLDEIIKNQDKRVIESITNVIDNNINFDDYMESVVDNYKKSLYNLVKYYKSDDEKYNEIKIKLLNDKMYEFVRDENYESAAVLRDKIRDLNKKGINLN